MYRTLLTVVIAATALASSAQTTFEQMKANPVDFGGIYKPYPITDDSQVKLSAVPAGYEPFYISHFSRHGSRYLISDNDLDNVIVPLRKAAKAGALTPEGLRVLDVCERFYEEMRGRGGELTPLGERQHRGIARRMYDANRKAFGKDATVTAVSTPVMRCAYSMMAFTEALKELDPTLNIPRESSNRNMYYLNHHTKESNAWNDDPDNVKTTLSNFRQSKTQPERLMKVLFNNPEYVKKHIRPNDLMWALYWAAVDLPNTEQGTSLIDIFTPEELFDLWQVFNYDFYAHNTSIPAAHGLHVDNANPTLDNMISTADSYIAEGKHGASLRFAHDGNLIPLAAKMKLAGCYGETNDPDSLYKVWTMQQIAPMASNIQMIFYRNKKNPDDIIVKLLLNEQETSVPMETDIFPYYHWADLREFFRSLTGTDNTTK